MIKGMTGFGTATVSSGDMKGGLEVKSVNHRYLDLVFYLPIGFGSVENSIRQEVAKVVKRGRVTISFKITERPEAKIILNKKAVKQYLAYAGELKKGFHLDNNLKISDLIKLPGVVDSREVYVQPQEIWPIMHKALKKSLFSLETMRKREGKALAKDLQGNLRRMSNHVKKIRARAKVLLRKKKRALVVEEFSSYQKSIDVNEEISRLGHYIDEFKSLLGSTGSVGKKLDFVGQDCFKLRDFH